MSSNTGVQPETSSDMRAMLAPLSHSLLTYHSTKKPVTTMLTYPWKCTVLHCNHLGNTWKLPLVLMTRHFDYHPRYRAGNNQSVGSSAPMVSRCFPGGYNVKLYISRGRLAWWLLAFLHSVKCCMPNSELQVAYVQGISKSYSEIPPLCLHKALQKHPHYACIRNTPTVPA